MSTEQNKALVQRIAESGGDWMTMEFAALDQACTFPFLARLGLSPTLQGYIEFWSRLRAPTLYGGYTIDEIVAEDDKVMIWITFTSQVTQQAVKFYRFNPEPQIGVIAPEVIRALEQQRASGTLINDELINGIKADSMIPGPFCKIIELNWFYPKFRPPAS